MSKPDDTITLTSNDIETEPGIGRPVDVLVLLRENTRLRAERNQALEQRDLAELTLERKSMPPTGKQAVYGWTVKGVQWAGVAVLLLSALAEVAAMYRPDLEGPIRTVIKLVKGFG